MLIDLTARDLADVRVESVYHESDYVKATSYVGAEAMCIETYASWYAYSLSRVNLNTVGAQLLLAGHESW